MCLEKQWLLAEVMFLSFFIAKLIKPLNELQFGADFFMSKFYRNVICNFLVYLETFVLNIIPRFPKNTILTSLAQH